MTTSGQAALAGLVLLVGVAFAARTTRGRARAALLGLLSMVTLGAAALVAARSSPPHLPPERPTPNTASTWVGSQACVACHPAEHATFARTFHRTMTQDANRATVLAPLETPVALRGGGEVRLEARGDTIWATLPDPDQAETSAPVERRVVLTTGSHREQTYWVHGKRQGELRLVPVVWLVGAARFVERRDAFLTPPDAPLPRVRWNSNCIACHAVAGEPGHDLGADAFRTRAADLGVACEACHGPGSVHVDRHRDPVARYMQHASAEGDPTIVQPRRLPPERSAAVCGQCHAYAFPRDESTFWSSGYARTFRAGDDLTSSRQVLFPEDLGEGEAAPRIEADLASLFWPDGTIRVGGREYNGLVRSPCFERGEGRRKLTCVSCHAMHAGDPAGQIDPRHAGARGNGMCVQCHEDARSTRHSHHAPGSEGDQCVACHMPKTSYALFSGVRSHRIASPSTASDDPAEMPNACNLCHLDRPLAWTERMLGRWFGRPTGRVAADRQTSPEGLVLALRGNAAVRVVIADALAQEGARLATPPGFAAPLLEVLARDPYAAVRFVAARGLARATPAGPASALDEDVVARLLAERDQRPITIAE